MNHTTLGWRVIKKKKSPMTGEGAAERVDHVLIRRCLSNRDPPVRVGGHVRSIFQAPFLQKGEYRGLAATPAGERAPASAPAGCRVQGSGCRVQGAGCRVQFSDFRVQGAGFRVQGPGSRVQDSGLRVEG